METTVTLADYLFTRLLQLGVESIHGVPGDYNLELLDYIEPNGLHWVGNCNELNAGYAADGYARAKGGLGAIITTFGVGELSAANAIAGAYAELVPVVHIVGTPARHLQKSRALIHHTMNNGDYQCFSKMHAYITMAQANLSDPSTCIDMIDTTLRQCIVQSRPVYIEIPTDMVSARVASTTLETPIRLPGSMPSRSEDQALSTILACIYASKKPMILVDGESRAYGVVQELHKLIGMTQWPTWTTVFGKSIIDETLSNYRGIWKGQWATQEDKDVVFSRDFILCFGPHFSSTNTYDYSSIPDLTVTTQLAQFHIKTPSQTFRDIPCKPFLKALLDRLDLSKLDRPDIIPPVVHHPNPSLPPNGPIEQKYFYRVLNPFFTEGDIILAETGTAGHGCRDFQLPPRTHLFKPSTWLSIGYMLPAAQGAGLAQRELYIKRKDHRDRLPRTVLIVGDGSFQMTVQELSTIIRKRLNMVLILINNNGYTIERCLHGRKQSYNDIASWKYLNAPGFFSGHEQDPNYSIETFSARTWGDLDDILATVSLADKDGLRMVEVFMNQEDAPPGPLFKALHEQRKVAV